MSTNTDSMLRAGANLKRFRELSAAYRQGTPLAAAGYCQGCQERAVAAERRHGAAAAATRRD